MKLKRIITVFMMIAVIAGCSVTVFAYSVGEGRVEDRYQFPGKAQLVATAYMTESGWGNNEIGWTASIIGDERDTVGTFKYRFFINYNDQRYDGYLGATLMGLPYGVYSHHETYTGDFDKGSTSIEKKDGGQIFVEARSYVDLY